MLNLLKGELSGIETSLSDKKVRIESFVAPPTLEDQAQIEALYKGILFRHVEYLTNLNKS